MIQIRNSVFETNSSSSHSIVVTKGEQFHDQVDPRYHVDDNGELKFWYSDDLEFGRSPFDVLCDWYGRLRYAIASFGKDGLSEIEAACKRHLIGFDHFSFGKNYDDEDDMGYVDHESSGLLSRTLRQHNISLDDFIFNDKYIVFIDGDEYCVFDRLRHSVLFNEDSIDYEVKA